MIRWRKRNQWHRSDERAVGRVLIDAPHWTGRADDEKPGAQRGDELHGGVALLYQIGYAAVGRNGDDAPAGRVVGDNDEQAIADVGRNSHADTSVEDALPEARRAQKYFGRSASRRGSRAPPRIDFDQLADMSSRYSAIGE